MSQNITDKLININFDVSQNRLVIDKILRIIQGNGEGGLISKVNRMSMRNQWFDRGVSIALSIFSTLLTLYLAGVLHI
jgi:hypothetical protein